MLVVCGASPDSLVFTHLFLRTLICLSKWQRCLWVAVWEHRLLSCILSFRVEVWLSGEVVVKHVQGLLFSPPLPIPQNNRLTWYSAAFGNHYRYWLGIWGDQEHLINIRFLHNHLGWSWDLDREPRTVFKALFGLYWTHLDVTSCTAPDGHEHGKAGGGFGVGKLKPNSMKHSPCRKQTSLFTSSSQDDWSGGGGATRFNSYLTFPSVVLAISDFVCVRRRVRTHTLAHILKQLININ